MTLSSTVNPAPPQNPIGTDFRTWTAFVNNTNLAGRVTRREAQTVPAVKRARDLICGTIGTLPLHAIRDTIEIPNPLLDQPESLHGRVRSVTIARTIEDLIYEGKSLWTVLDRTFDGWPKVVQHITYGEWSQDHNTGTIRVSGNDVPNADVILFDSLNDPLLVVGGPAVRMLSVLERTSATYADNPQAQEYFQAEDGYEPDDAAIVQFLDQWVESRRERSTGFVPAGISLNTIPRMSPEEIQLVGAREFGIIEIARLAGIDPKWLGINTANRTYQNVQDERRHFIDFTCGPYIHAIEERLSLGDITPVTQRVRFNLDSFLRADTLSRYQAHQMGILGGFLTPNEARAYEDLAPLPGGDSLREPSASPGPATDPSALPTTEPGTTP